MAEKKRFVRSRTNRLVGGVLGGIAEYFGWNANLLRVIYVLITIATPFVHGILGLAVYVILYTFMPLEERAEGSNPSLRDLFRGADPTPKDEGRKVIHDVTEQDVKDSHKDGD
ncbi:PspC domain-containing protein [Levilactobacillus tujiorum]|uniref:PspC domain-containing protein n=1 Tax=Levilactobacillus tujiorum TaxID=2912243 RepID=A0ABX1L537_9LACO|nr:PspC domain-containing protein [Levilactobacillus tujiorum]MCH5464462.1 PspC domain-containing protein [Levilactobacillus tujiorum]NLR11482.1 PspC domain-containing protein [Lactobacillus sp. HBUAS51387]NLR29436.1 PspC domain-containing protein [Levilactobacillus tujiorum]